MNRKSSTADDPAFSKDALRLIGSEASDGGGMIAITRAVLSGRYDESVHNSGILDVFQCIADESDNVVLAGFGEYNALPAYVGMQPMDEQGRKLEALFEFYRPIFEEALAAFRRKFRL